ncbi:MAG: hypothetical protein KBB01_01135 [Candidatus Omnitrophica bacterium]|jgi:hypothetical protein|nr:hypothetical protein [Candidatus Omnitrophota bacterium]
MVCKKKPKSKKKAKSLVCVVCKGDKKTQKKKSCCDSAMLSEDKGSWNI